MDIEFLAACTLAVVTVAAIFSFNQWDKRRQTLNLFKEGRPVLPESRIEMETYISREEFIHARIQLFHTFLTGGYAMVIVIGYFVTAGLMIYQFVKEPALRNDRFFIGVSIAPFVLLPLIVLVIIKYVLPSAAASQYDTSEFVKEKVKCVFDSYGYRMTSAFVDIHSGWETIQNYMVIGNYILIFYEPNSSKAYFLDKAAFAPDDLLVFERFLSNNFVRKKHF